VGLDVVKSNLISLKGHVSVQSIPGQGTTFILRVPLTLSSERGLLVKCGDHQFVMPTSFIKRVMMLKPSDLIEVTGGQAIMVDEHPIPYCSLANVLALPNTNSSFECLPTVVVYNSNNSVALLVDKIIGEREIVVKSFQKPLNKIDYAGGATLLDHNQLAVVLNIDDLVRHALNIQNVTRIEPQDNVRIMHEKTHILVVDDSITTRTLEKNVLENKNYRVTTAVNGQEAWDLLQKQKFSLMITDISMPIMDGFTLTERVKNSEKLRDLPIIIVTSLGSDTEKARGMEVGANAYVIKSEFESGALLDIIAQLV